MGRRTQYHREPIDYEALERFITDIREILKMAGKKACKNDLLAKIKKHTANYSGWRSPAIRTTVTHFIVVSAKNICGVAFGEEEVR